MSIITIPNAGSTLAAATFVSGCRSSDSKPLYTWLGLRTPAGASGSVCWYKSSTCTSGCEFLPIALAALSTEVYGPFMSSTGWYAAGVSGGCAIIHQKL